MDYEYKYIYICINNPLTRARLKLVGGRPTPLQNMSQLG